MDKYHHLFVIQLFILFINFTCAASWVTRHFLTESKKSRCLPLNGWLESLFSPKGDDKVTISDSNRNKQYPEQYPATYELLSISPLLGDGREGRKVRPLLKQTQLENRRLDLVYDANKQGWTSDSFHKAVDRKGASIVLATLLNNKIIGGYNPKGWASMGGARPSVASFLFYTTSEGKLQKLRKVGGGGLACSRDDPWFGISFGPDALVISLQPMNAKLATSKLGPYFEKGPECLSSLFPGGSCRLKNVQVLVGRYEKDEVIPYSGAVFDMTSG